MHAFYYAMNRVVDGLYPLGPDDRDKFVEFMREYEHFCGVRVVTYSVTDEEFQIELEVPREPDTPLTDEELLARIESLSGSGGSKSTRQRLTLFRKLEQHETAEALRQRFLVRMWSLCQFMKALEQRFTQWFNKKHDRRGTLWQSRFKSTLVESQGEALVTLATYVDINSLRARVKEHPSQYRWCGYGQALLGNKEAQEGLRLVVAKAKRIDPQSLSLAQAIEQYRTWLPGPKKQTEGTDDTGQPVRAELSAEQVMEVVLKNGKVSPKDYVKLTVRYLTDGLVVGCQIFINEMLDAYRPRWPKRRERAIRMQGVESDNLYVLAKLRRDVFGRPRKTIQPPNTVRSAA